MWSSVFTRFRPSEKIFKAFFYQNFQEKSIWCVMHKKHEFGNTLFPPATVGFGRRCPISTEFTLMRVSVISCTIPNFMKHKVYTIHHCGVHLPLCAFFPNTKEELENQMAFRLTYFYFFSKLLIDIFSLDIMTYINYLIIIERYAKNIEVSCALGLAFSTYKIKSFL